MMFAAIALPALVCALAALFLRKQLRRASWITWLGYMLIGAGVPVLAGQAGALAIIEMGNPAHAAVLLGAGLSGGLGWAAGAVSARVTRPKSEAED
jgi:hypothetical protein